MELHQLPRHGEVSSVEGFFVSGLVDRARTKAARRHVMRSHCRVRWARGSRRARRFGLYQNKGVKKKRNCNKDVQPFHNSPEARVIVRPGHELGISQGECPRLDIT
jgi:hypothetical protein